MYALLNLCWIFFRLGVFNFGGGYAMIATIGNILTSMNYIDASTYADIVTISQMTPGPLAVNVATFVGKTVMENQGFGVVWQILGSLLTTICVSIPAFIFVILVAKLLKNFYETKQVKWILNGIRPATIGLIASAMIFFINVSVLDATVNLGNKFMGVNLSSIAICGVILILNLKTKFSIIWLILISAVLGVLIL